MFPNDSARPLAIGVFASGFWDLFAAFVYAFLIGTVITEPPTDRFSALFIASFLLCFAWLLFLSACNIRRYLLVVGAVIIGRVLYAVLLFASVFGVAGFPADLWWTGVIDLFWSVLYIVLAAHGGIRIRDLFLPCRDGN